MTAHRMQFPEVPGKTPREKFENLARMMFAVPKADIEEKKRPKKRRKRAAAVAGVIVIIGAALTLTSCYTPKKPTIRPAAVGMPTTAEGKACWRGCMQTEEVCRLSCPHSYTYLNAHEVEREAQACVDRCADKRDVCLSTCN
ncbi:MAG: hypothetical protein ACHQ9S_24235 [Candidatus Binatia bacterium]